MRRFSVRLLPLLGLAALITCLVHSSALAEIRALSSHVPAAAARARLVGKLPGSTRLNLALGLPLRDLAGLTNFLAQLYDPANPLYHQYLTPDQFTARFGPTPEEYQQVLNFARAHGLEITAVHPNRMLVDVSAPGTAIEQAFHLNLQLYSHPNESRNFFAPATEPSLDSTVPVKHISGLDNFIIPRPASLRPSPSGPGSNPLPALGSGPGGSYRGNDFRGAYARGVSSSLNGAGQMVGLFEFDGFFQSDITAYELNAGLPNVPMELVLTDGADGSASTNNIEVALDIEMVISMAPGLSQVLVYEASGPTGLANDILNRMATDNLAKQLSASWTFPTDSTTSQILMQFAAQGQTYFNASGDDGAFPGATRLPPEDPYITLVGGTTLNTTGPGGAWVSETVWHSPVGASGGGTSPSIPIPTWQQGLNMTANKGSTTLRNSPDVAMVADGVWVNYDNGSGGVFGGTSCASPLWAGFMAIVNQQAVSFGKPTIGFFNPVVYNLGTAAGYTTNFHDITVGNNTNSGSPTQFFAVAGYDLCTGWGTPIGLALINTLAPRVKAPLITNSAATLVAEGCVPANGAIDPGETVTVNYSLKNLGAIKTTNLVVTLQADAGVIAPGAPQSYGSLSGGGAAVTRPFSFTANASCGGSLTTTLLLQDGPANLGTLTANFPIGKPLSAFAESFDSVTAPALPAGWTSTIFSNAVNWVTASTAKDSGTLSAFAGEPTTPGVADLTSPPIQITTPTAQLIFKNYYNTETDPTVTNAGMAYDGGVLEIQVGNSAFADILAVGGSFVTGGYTEKIIATDDNPLDGRRVWSGNSGGFITTIVNLPANAAGKTIRLKWRFGTDTGNYYGGLGWYIDTISINDGFTCCNSSADLAVSQAVSPDPAFVDRDVTYTITLTNQGPDPAYSVVVTDVLPANVTFSSASPGCVYTNGTVQCAIGTLPNNGTTSILITVNPLTTDSLTNAISISAVTADPNSTNNSSSVTTAVTAISPPVVAVQPTNVIVGLGGNAQFQITAQGAPTLAYQWFFNGTNLLGATGNVLSLTNVQPQHAGGYSVAITNSYGSVTSTVAQLTVILPPTISLSPVNVSATNVAITLNSFVGLTYTLEYKNTLQDSNWTDILPSLPGTSGILFLQDTNGFLFPSRFYRVRSD